MKNIKTIINLTLCLLWVGAMNAQQSTVAHEQISNDGHYKFWIEAEEGAFGQLVDLYFQISQEPAITNLTGNKSHTLRGGVVLAIDAEQQELAVIYEGTDEETLTHAKGLSHKLTQYLESYSPAHEVADTYSSSTLSEEVAAPARNTVAVTNTANGQYNFHITVAEDQLTDLITTFIDLSGKQLAADFQGEQQITLDGGVVMSIDTDNYKLLVNYEGEDQKVKSRAKAIGERANAYLGGHGQ